jgi:predicted O-methyltransferase YrrM
MLSDSQQMTDQAFIEFCYQRILRRNPNEGDKAHYSQALSRQQVTREVMMLQLLTCDEYTHLLNSQEFVPAGHFYSVVPSLATRNAFLTAELSDEVLGIALNAEQQFTLLQQFKPFHDSCIFPDQKTDPFRYYFLNPAYSYTDGLTLHSMMRIFKPKRIIEIGSGFSSCMMLDTNDHFFDGQIQCTFIEPYPELLHSLMQPEDAQYHVIGEGVQTVDTQLFTELQANDILFIDSTHVSKLGSDVNRILFDILPLLQSGVIIHFHDIFWPFEYPKEWIKEGRAWNEIYLLRAFLEFNSEFELLFFANYLHQHHQNWFQDNMPLYLKNAGGNIWLRKR